MNGTGRGNLSARADELRSEFDRGFAVAAKSQTDAGEAFLAIDAGGDRYALRLAEISAVHTDRKIVALPDSPAELLGIAAFRGTLIAVYDLRVLLGYKAATAPRWLVLTAPQAPIGLAFDRLDGYLRLPRAAVAQDDRPERRTEYLGETLTTADGPRPIVSLAAVIESINERAQAGVPQGGR